MNRKEAKRFLTAHSILFKELAKKANVTPSAVSMWFKNDLNSTAIKESFIEIYNSRIESNDFYFKIEV